MSHFTEHRFRALCQRTAPRLNAATAFSDLSTAYSQPSRHYHNGVHIADCLSLFDTVRDSFEHPDAAEFALWYHDAVYDSRAHDNEARSAVLAANQLRTGGATSDIIQRVERLILATRHKETPIDAEAKLLVDIDLSILGRDELAFDAYDNAIRQEYAWVPDDAYRIGRTGVLRGFLERPRIYNTDTFFAWYELRARENIARAIEALGRCALPHFSSR